MKKRVVSEFILITLALAAWLVIGFLWGSMGLGTAAINWAVALLLVASALVLVFVSMKYGVGVFTGLLILAGLFLPNSSLVAHPSFYQPQPFRNIFGTLLFFMPSLALVMAALLMRSGINRYQKWRGAGTLDAGGSQVQRKQVGRAALVFLVLSLLLLSKTLDNLYWLMIWDTANDSIGYFLLVVPVLAVLFSGSILSITLRDRAKLAGLFYSLFVLALMFAVSASAQRVDFRQLTEARAGQVSQAIETYYAREGHYPQDLGQLSPWTLLSIPGPVIIYGQGWCYQGGVDYYGLGYIYRDAWFSPLLTGRIYQTKAQAPDLSHLCDSEMAALQISYPDYPWTYAMDGE